MFTFSPGDSVQVMNGAKKPSAHKRGSLRNWKELNFKGTVVRNIGHAIQVKNEDLSGSNSIVLRWFDYDSAITIRSCVFERKLNFRALEPFMAGGRL